MGFSFHPGPLPFVTIRRQQWANRLTVGENIEIHGEHGCDMPPIAAKVRAMEALDAPLPEHLIPVYRNQPCVRITLTETEEPWRKVGESWQKVLDAHKKTSP